MGSPETAGLVEVEDVVVVADGVVVKWQQSGVGGEEEWETRTVKAGVL
jgi:hypothetical protein